MSAKCYDIESLVDDDLFYHFGFCQNKVGLKGDIGRVIQSLFIYVLLISEHSPLHGSYADARMKKAEMKAYMKAELDKLKRKKTEPYVVDVAAEPVSPPSKKERAVRLGIYHPQGSQADYPFEE